MSAALLSVFAAGYAQAQELEPRIYIASPLGTNLVVAAATRSTGDVILDPTVPIKDAHARVGALAGAYYRTFGLFGRSASAGVTVPFVRASAEGLIASEPRRVSRLGQGDIVTRLTVNIAGSPAMDTPTFVKRGPRPELAASIVTVLPTGQYNGARAINIGANRWAFKPEIGLTAPLGRWRADIYGGVWLFTGNDDYLGGRRQQEALYTSQLHFSYNLSRRSWASFDATFYSGGRTTTNGVGSSERLSNARLGGTISLPVGARQTVRFSASHGARVRVGTNFTTIALSWSYVWGRGF